METIKVRLTLIDGLLGTAPLNYFQDKAGESIAKSSLVWYDIDSPERVPAVPILRTQGQADRPNGIRRPRPGFLPGAGVQTRILHSDKAGPVL